MLNQASQERLERRLCLLLSWRDKAKALAGKKREPRAFDAPPGGAIEEEGVYFSGQVEAAEKALESFRSRLRQRCQHAADRVQVARHQQKSLPDRVAKGKLSPAAANDENRRLLAEIEAQSAEANLTHRLLQITSTEAIGGHIEMPLPRYARELDRFASESPQKKPAVVLPIDHPVEVRKEKAPRTFSFPFSFQNHKLNRWDRWAILTAVVAVLITAFVLIMYGTQGGGNINFDLLPAPEGAWRLVCENKTGGPIILAVPGDSTGIKRYDYQVVVETDSEGGSDFRAVPGTTPAWKFLDAAGFSNPYTLASGLTGSWAFDPRHPSVADTTGPLRIRIMTRSGKEIFSEPLSVTVRK